VKGGYHSLQHSEKPELRVVAPVHRKDLAPGTIRSIIKQCQLTEQEFIELL
jgi:predicted RNA binding protein YcfA (HicA-like mRNA interferase family)